MSRGSARRAVADLGRQLPGSRQHALSGGGLVKPDQSQHHSDMVRVPEGGIIRRPAQQACLYSQQRNTNALAPAVRRGAHQTTIQGGTNPDVTGRLLPSGVVLKLPPPPSLRSPPPTHHLHLHLPTHARTCRRRQTHWLATLSHRLSMGVIDAPYDSGDLTGKKNNTNKIATVSLRFAERCTVGKINLERNLSKLYLQ